MTKFYNFYTLQQHKEVKIWFYVLCFLFVSFAQAQTTFTNNTSVPIDDFQEANSTITSTLSGTYGVDYIITNVSITIPNHGWAEDIIINLISPDGTILVLSHFNGGATNSYGNTQFEFAGDDISVAPTPFNGIYEPQGGTFIDAFRDENVNGDWTLSVYDNWAAFEGDLTSFSITFDTVPTCLWPTNVSASPLNPTSANVYWRNIAEAVNGYDWVLMAEGDDPDTDIPIQQSGSAVFTNTATFTGLTTGTTYDFYVKSNCGGLSSVWSSRERFTVSLDYCGANNFYDNGGPSSNYDDNSFEKITISPLISGNKVTADFLSFNTEQGFDGLLIYDGPNTNSPLISSGYVSPNTGSVPDGAWTGTGQFSADGEVITSTHPTGTLTFFFRSNAVTTGSGWEAEINCGTTPLCAIPENFLATNVGFTEVDLEWDPPITPANGGYEYLLVTDGTTPGSSATPTGSVGVGITSVSLSGLGQTTTHDAYVRAVCGAGPDGDRSAWTAAQTFTTLTSCVAPQNLTATNIGPFDADLEWDATTSGENDGYEYVIYTDGTIPDVSTPGTLVPTGSTSANVTGLTPATTYTAYVRALCGPGDTSAWSSVETFTTPVTCVAPSNLQADNVTATTVDLSWDATPSDINIGYEWVLMTPGDDPETDTPLLSGDSGVLPTSTTAFTLSPATTYDAYVRAVCSPGDFSEWTAVAVTFTTLCVPEPVPWLENFDNITIVGDSDDIPDCWESTGPAFSTSAEAIPPNLVANSGTNYLYHFFSNETTIFTPAINLTALQSYDFSFFHQTNSGVSGVSFEIYAGTSKNTSSMDLLGGVTNASNSTYLEFTIPFIPNSTEPYYFALRVLSDNNFKAIAFDDFSLEEASGATSYTYSGGTYSPSDPSGVNEPLSTLTVLDGTAVISSPTTLGSITIKPGAVLDPDADITADFVFESDATGFGQLDNTSGTTITGSARTENFIPARRVYRLMSPSATTSGTIRDNWQEGVNNTGINYPGDNINPESGYGTHITGSTTGLNGFDATQTGEKSLYYFDKNIQDWVPGDNTDTDNLVAGEPLFILIRGDRSTNLNSNTAVGNDTRLRTEGNLRIGDVSHEIPDLEQGDDLYNLIGNPYQAILDFDGVTRTGLTDYIYVWDAAIGGANGVGGYVSVELSTGTVTELPPGLGSSNASQFISPGQAFFVQNDGDLATDTTISITESDKAVMENEITVFSTYPHFYINSSLYKTSDYENGETVSDAIGLRFSNDFTTLADTEDAVKFFNTNENYAIINNGYRSIDKQNLPVDNHEVIIDISNYTATNYTLTFQLGNAPDNISVYLKDTYLDTETVLLDSSTYAFSIDQNTPESFAQDRFSLVFRNTTLGINGNTFGENFSLFPNPTKGQFTIHTPNLRGEVSVEILNLLGQIVSVQQLSVENKQVKVNAGYLSAGVYIVKLNQGNQYFSSKLIVH